MALEPIANVAGVETEPAALQLATVSQELRAFDAVSRVKRFETSQEMRFAAWAESRRRRHRAGVHAIRPSCWCPARAAQF